MQPEVHLPAAKRRKQREREEMEEMDKDWQRWKRWKKKLRRGKTSEADVDSETDEDF